MYYKTKTNLRLIYIVVFIIYLNEVKAQENPCPGVFEYRDDGEKGYGIITIPSPGLGTTIVSVELAIIGELSKGYGEKLDLFKTRDETINNIRKGRNIEYRLNFPRSNGFPFIISIVVNGNIKICSTSIDGNFTTMLFNHTLTYPRGNLNPSNPYPNAIKPKKPPRTPESPVTLAPRYPEPNRYANECGRRNETYTGVTHTVIGGFPVREGEYPWLVALYKVDRENRPQTFLCGGNLVSNNHVITAAHCIGSEQRLYMELGKYDLSNSQEVGYEVRVSERILTHSEYRSNTGHADIAIITFNQAVSFTNRIRSICLWPFGSNSNSLDGVIAGWGRELQRGPTSDKPLQLVVEMVSQEQCDTDVKLRSISSSKTFCAGGKSKGPCHGDSGGGFYLLINNRWYLRGIISTSLGNNWVCDVNKYAVYADVAHYLDWIKSILN